MLGRSFKELIAGTNTKTVTLELGGKKQRYTIFEDAPIRPGLVEGEVNGIFLPRDMLCCAGSRFICTVNL
jgi:acyl-CoA reductase-like NAD-dependent aldehyde dehydrogenase